MLKLKLYVLYCEKVWVHPTQVCRICLHAYFIKLNVTPSQKFLDLVQKFEAILQFVVAKLFSFGYWLCNISNIIVVYLAL